MEKTKLPPEAGTIKDLNNISGIIALIFGILLLIVGIVFSITIIGMIIGVPLIIFAVINILIWTNLKEINRLIDDGEFRRAKDKEILWMILGFILGLIIPGILLLIAYIKYDDLIRHSTE